MKALMKTTQDQLNTFYLNSEILSLMQDSHHVDPIIETIFWGVIKDSENDKSTQSMFNKTNSDEYKQKIDKHDPS